MNDERIEAMQREIDVLKLELAAAKDREKDVVDRINKLLDFYGELNRYINLQRHW